MNKRRFRPLTGTQHVRYAGVITLEDIKKKFNIPDGATVSVKVPGGGDWSGMDIDMGVDFETINVSWEKIR